MKGFLPGLVVLGLFLGVAAQARSQFMYWSEATGGDIRRANLDGSGQVTLLSRLAVPIGPTLDLAGGQMYWADTGAGAIRRANLDGSGQTTLVSGLPPADSNGPSAMPPALDLARGQMYWTDGTLYGPGVLRRANLDGSEQTILVTGLGNGRGVALDLAGGQMYWSEFTAGRIRRANLDGSGVTTLLQRLTSPLHVALDLAGGKIYWSGYYAGQILRANLDGSGQEILVRNQNGPDGIALDLACGQMYWTNINNGDIRRANLDGTGQETLLTGLNHPDFISLDLGAPGTAVYFALAAPANVPPATPFDVTVTALDPYGNAAVDYQGTVTFTSSDVYPGLLPADYTFTSDDQGRHTFSGEVTFFTAGAQRLMAQDIANSSITGSATVAVVAAPASQLLITASATAVSGKPFDVALAALDPYANVDMNYAGTVTWTSSDTDPGVILPADYTFQATDKGSVAFPGGVTLITPGDQTITATDTASGITRTVTVTVVPPN
jgi:sugar lactone lactonase YvrE